MKKVLGIEYQVSGKVIYGDGFGKTLGFPTANLDRREFVRKKIKVRLGVWAGVAEVLGSRFKVQGKYKAGIVIGPVDKTGLPKIEAHLVGFKGNLYGKKISIYLKKYLRPFRKYKNIEELKKQIAADVEKVKKLKN